MKFREFKELGFPTSMEMAINWLQNRLNEQGFLDYDDIFDLRSLIVEL